MSTIINGTSSAITFPDTTVQNTAFTTGAVTQSTIGTNVAGTGPAFSAWQATLQTLSANTWTKITLDTEQFDTNNNFASSRFTPTVAGYYQITGSVYVSAGNTTLVPAIYKNGSAWKQGTYLVVAASVSAIVSALVYLNGTTDYVELYGYSNTTVNTGPYDTGTYLQGAMVRAA